MKRIFALTIILIALTACTAPQTQAGLPNPASVYCTQNGNKLETHTAADGSQYGICVFSDGSTCDEWAYFRGECGPATQTSSTPVIVVETTTEYDDYFERQDLGQIIYFGIDSMDPAVKSQIESLRDNGKIVHLYGTLLSNVPDYNGSQVQVDCIEVEE